MAGVAVYLQGNMSILRATRKGTDAGRMMTGERDRPYNAAQLLAYIQIWMSRVLNSPSAFERVSSDVPLDGTYWAWADGVSLQICPADQSDMEQVCKGLGMKIAERVASLQAGGDEPLLMRLRLRAGVAMIIQIDDLGIDDVALYARTTSAKLICGVRHRATGNKLAIIKCAGHSHMADNLAREMAALRAMAGCVAAPIAIQQVGTFDDGRGPAMIVQNWCRGVLVVQPGAIPSGLHWSSPQMLVQIGNWLKALPKDGGARSFRDLAAQYKVMIEAHERLLADEKIALRGLLSRVTDERHFATSWIHGDLRPNNLLFQATEKRLVALDWEFSREGSFAVLDLVRYALEVAYSRLGASSFADMLTPHVRGLLSEVQRSGLPGCEVSLDELLAMQFVIHYTDRIGSFGRMSVRMKFLQQVLQGEARRSA